MLDLNTQVNEKRKNLIVDMQSELKEYNATAISEYKNIFISKDKDVAYTHIYVVFNDLIFRISKRNCEDQEKFITDCLFIFDIIANHNINTVKLRKISEVTGVYAFSSLILIPYEYCNHNPISEKTLKKTVVVAPIYDCEFSGDETKEELEVMINGPLATINIYDWEREISPKLKMSYTNFTSQSGSRSRVFKIAKSQNLHWAISALKDDVSYVGFENFRHEKYKVALNNNGLFLTPTIKYLENDFYKIVNEILWGNFSYPQKVSLSEKIDIDALEASNSQMTKLLDNEINKCIEISYISGKINRKKNKYTFYNSDKQVEGVLEYSLFTTNYYKDNGCSISMSLEAYIDKCKVSDILNNIGLPCNNDCFVFNQSSIKNNSNHSSTLRFYIAHGIYNDIISNSSFVVALMQKMNNLIEGNIEAIKDIETYPILYKYPLATSLIILYLNNCSTEFTINQLLATAEKYNFSDLDKSAQILIKIANYFN